VDQEDILYQIHALASQSAVEMWLQNTINVLGNRYDSAWTQWMSLQHGHNLRSRKKTVKNVAWTFFELRKTIHGINFFSLSRYRDLLLSRDRDLLLGLSRDRDFIEVAIATDRDLLSCDRDSRLHFRSRSYICYPYARSCYNQLLCQI